MDRYQSELVEETDNNVATKAFRILVTTLSVLTLILIIFWTINLYERDIEDLPIIAALQDEIRVKPEDSGGQEIDFKGFSVNEILEEGSKDENVNSVILMAPRPDTLLPEETSPVLTLPENQGPGGDLIASSITSALETLLGIERQDEDLLTSNIELHIASYSTAEEANAHWFLLQQLNADLLENYNHQVIQVNDAGKRIFRLRIKGFESLALAQDMCAQLVDRGEKCVPARMGQKK